MPGVRACAASLGRSGGSGLCLLDESALVPWPPVRVHLAQVVPDLLGELAVPLLLPAPPARSPGAFISLICFLAAGVFAPHLWSYLGCSLASYRAISVGRLLSYTDSFLLSLSL